MGVRYDYFSAPDDDHAATVVRWPDGPSRPETRRRRGFGPSGLDNEAADAIRLSPMALTRVDPIVQCGRLEELLTGRVLKEAMDDPRSGHLLASRRLSSRLVLTVNDGLMEALAAVDVSRSRELATAWSLTEEQIRNRATSESLLVVLSHLVAVASYAQRMGYRMYCWGST